jgi:hypothetical protein
VNTEIFFSPRGNLDSWLTVESTGRIVYSTVGPGYRVDEVLSIEEAISRWKLYREDIQEAVEATHVHE